MPHSPADLRKKAVAEYVLEHLLPELSSDRALGIGTGSTTNFFIDALAQYKDRIGACVVSSSGSEERLARHGIEAIPMSKVDSIPLYIDGADECDPDFALIKGGGAALTREKIIASAAERFICIMDESKLVDQLGAFPLPVEVIPMATAWLVKRLSQLGGSAQHRADCVTDNGNHIIDVSGLNISDPKELEATINHMPGVVTCGLFAMDPADEVYVGRKSGVEKIHRRA